MRINGPQEQVQILWQVIHNILPNYSIYHFSSEKAGNQLEEQVLVRMRCIEPPGTSQSLFLLELRGLDPISG